MFLLYPAFQLYQTRKQEKKKDHKWSSWQPGSWGKISRERNSFWGQTSVYKKYINRNVVFVFIQCYLFLYV